VCERDSCRAGSSLVESSTMLAARRFRSAGLLRGRSGMGTNRNAAGGTAQSAVGPFDPCGGFV
jgi:hypothetical protein